MNLVRDWLDLWSVLARLLLDSAGVDGVEMIHYGDAGAIRDLDPAPINWPHFFYPGLKKWVGPSSYLRMKRGSLKQNFVSFLDKLRNIEFEPVYTSWHSRKCHQFDPIFKPPPPTLKFGHFVAQNLHFSKWGRALYIWAYSRWYPSCYGGPVWSWNTH